MLVWVPMKKILCLLHNCNVRPVFKALILAPPSLPGFGGVSVTITRGKYEIIIGGHGSIFLTKKILSSPK